MSKTRNPSVRRGCERGVAALTVATGLALIGTGLLTGAAGAASMSATITVTQNKTWGPTLTLKGGDTRVPTYQGLHRQEHVHGQVRDGMGARRAGGGPEEARRNGREPPRFLHPLRRECAKSRTKASPSTPSSVTRRLAR